MPSTVYIPMKPSSVNMPLPADTSSNTRRPSASAHKPARLAAEFRRHPTRGVGDVGKWETQHQDPEHPFATDRAFPSTAETRQPP